MGRSWRNFFRRSKGSEEESGTVVETQEPYSDGAVPEESEPLEAPVTTAETRRSRGRVGGGGSGGGISWRAEVVESEAWRRRSPKRRRQRLRP
jgi:hypothetical protein